VSIAAVVCGWPVVVDSPAFGEAGRAPAEFSTPVEKPVEISGFSDLSFASC
jgi:hypothetical protein